MGIVVGCYFLYSLVAVPWIEGPQQVKRKTSELSKERFAVYQDKTDILALLPGDAWEADPCIIIATKNGKIYFRDHKQLADGSVELYPLTMLFTPKPSAGDKQPPRPVLLRALEGAVLKFDRPMTLGGDQGKLQGGRILGEVTITRLPSAPGQNDAFDLTTRNVQLLNNRIQTLDTVDFRFGSSWGRGRHLIVELEQNGESPGGKSTISDAGDVRRMELVHLDRLHVEQSAKSPKKTSRGLIARQPRVLEVLCDGAFEYDWTQDVARFNENVRVEATDQPGDELRADFLELGFEKSKGDQVVVRRVEKPTSKGDLELKHLIARGRPATMVSRKRQVSVTGESITYNFGRQEIHVRSRTNAKLIQLDQELTCPDFRYAMPEDQSLGTALAQGPGRLIRKARVDSEPIDLSWTDRMVIQPRDGMKIISTYGSTAANMGESRLNADEVHFWVWETPKPQPLDLQRPLGTVAAPAEKSPSDKWVWHPARLLAVGNVYLKSKRVEGRTTKLQVFWPQQSQALGFRTGARRRYVSKTTVDPKRTTSTRRQEPTSSETIRESGLQAVSRPKSKLFFNGREVRAHALATDSSKQPRELQRGQREKKETFEFKELVIEGDVHVEELAPGTTEPRLQIDGNQLKLTPQTPPGPSEDDQPLYRMDVYGTVEKSANIRAKGMNLSAEAIHLDQQNNRLWVDGQGEMDVEPKKKPQRQTLPNERSKPRLNGKLKRIGIGWQGGMVFDGRQIYFERNVQTQSLQLGEKDRTETDTQSQAINLTLDRYVSLIEGADGKLAEEIEIETMALVGHLESPKLVFETSREVSAVTRILKIVSRQTDSRNRLKSIRRIDVPWANLYTATGRLESGGPGEVKLWSVPSDNKLSLGGFASAKRDRERTRDGELDFVQVKFEQSIVGNTDREEMVFQGGVRALYGPVTDWQKQWDVDRTRLTGGLVKLTCDQLEVAQWQPRSSETKTLDMTARGNSQMFGEQFEAASEKIAYNQSQNQVVLEGNPRNDAELHYQTEPHQPRSPLVATKIIYRLEDSTTQVYGFKRGVINTGPIFNKRGSK